MLLNTSKIRTQKVEDTVAKHFCQKNHCGKNFKVIGIEKTETVTKFTEKLRNQKTCLFTWTIIADE
jgi:hypothetical protein